MSNNIINDDPDNVKPANCIKYIPCAKFVVASLVSVGVCVFGCTMLATGGITAPLAPFYTSLISGSVLYWAPPPSATDKK